MKIINLAGSCLCATYIIFLFITKQINPCDWTRLAWALAGAFFCGLLCVCIIVQRGIDKQNKDNEKYFEDKTHE